ncbi:hypothetical protein ACSZOC_19625 [Aeromonas hydrophila]
MFNGVRVFDTVLDGKNTRDMVSRNSADFWKPFCKSAGWNFNYERIHSLNDLKYFFSKKSKRILLYFQGMVMKMASIFQMEIALIKIQILSSQKKTMEK